MKTLLVAAGSFFTLSALTLAEDPKPFASTPFELAPSLSLRTGPALLPDPLAPKPAPAPAAESHSSGFSVPLPVGPVRIEYGLPIRGKNAGAPPQLDSPGPGYREQKAQSR